MSKPTIDNCVLCLDEKVSPVRIDCGHSFCHSCWEQFMSYTDECSWARRCPICRRPLDGRSSPMRIPFVFERADISGFFANALMPNGVEGGSSLISFLETLVDSNNNFIPNNCHMHPTSSGALEARVTPTAVDSSHSEADTGAQTMREDASDVGVGEVNNEHTDGLVNEGSDHVETIISTGRDGVNADNDDVTTNTQT